MKGLAEIVRRAVDSLYIPLLRKLVPRETFRYFVCGGLNMVLGWCVYSILYRYVVAGRWLDLGFIVMSPHTLSLVIQFPITFFAGFWLNRRVTFTLSTLTGSRQLGRYVLQNAGALLVNYLLLKLFVEAAHIYPPAARPLTDLIVAVYSYLTARLYTFRR